MRQHIKGNKMKHSERFALNQWLSDYPDDATYEDIIAMMKDEDSTWRTDGIDVWVAVETFPLANVAEFIDDTRCAVERMMDNLEYGLPLAEKTEEESIEEGAM
jgi:hypothetical protein